MEARRPIVRPFAYANAKANASDHPSRARDAPLWLEPSRSSESIPPEFSRIFSPRGVLRREPIPATKRKDTIFTAPRWCRRDLGIPVFLSPLRDSAFCSGHRKDIAIPPLRLSVLCSGYPIFLVSTASFLIFVFTARPPSRYLDLKPDGSLLE